MGWIKLDRSILDNDIWRSSKEKPFSDGQAWIDLLLLAEYETHDGFCRYGAKRYERGTVYMSKLEMAQRWNWSRNRVLRFLRTLNRTGMCTVNETTHGTTVTIVNYGKYQDSGATDGATNGATDGATDGATGGAYLKNKRNKEVKKGPSRNELIAQIVEDIKRD